MGVGRKGRRNTQGTTAMQRTSIQQRLARLQRECEASAAPALVLLLACLVLALTWDS